MGSPDTLAQSKAILSVFNARVFEATNAIYVIIQPVEGKLTYTVNRRQLRFRISQRRTH